MLSKVQHRCPASSLSKSTTKSLGQANNSLSNTSLIIPDLKDQTTPKFVDSIPDRLICRICKDALREPVQSSCGCRFCERCADFKFLIDEKIKCPGNDIDCKDLLRNELHHDNSAKREIVLLLVYCSFKDQGCNVTVPWKKLMDHERNCEYRLVPCRFHNNGCKEIVVLKSMDVHTQKCKYQPIVCKYCNEEVAKVKRKEHEKIYCIKIPLPCPYGCQIEKMTREKMEVHITECPNTPEDCPYKILGCKFTGTKDDIVQHKKSSTKEHLQFTTVFAAKIDLDAVQIKRDLQRVNTEREAYRRDLENFVLQCESLRMDEEDLKSRVKDTMMKIVAHAERIIVLERKMEDCASKSSVDAQQAEIRQLKERLERFMEKITEMERGQNSLGTSSSNSVQDYQRSQKHLMDQLRHHDRQIGIQDIRLAELDLRYQVLQTASYGGVMIWKICDYSRRKQEAVIGRTLSLYSQPFYSDQFGYKMCGRVYLQGDGIGKGSHLSFYFVVMRGEYDALLQWPFRKQVTLALLDQDRSGRDILERFEPDPCSNSFTRPTSEMNIASGCPQFVCHRILEMPSYIKDDTLFLKIEVSD